jgi:Arylsulfotransferase (ASST)
MSVDEHTPAQSRLSRRQLLKATGVLAVGAWALDGSRLLSNTEANLVGGPQIQAPGQAIHDFRSRPDLRIAETSVAGAFGPGSHLLLGPKAIHGAQGGPLIVDSHGQPVFFRPVVRWATNVRVQEYRGESVLTWWEGVVDKQGYGQGEGVIVDRFYREVARVRAVNGHTVDLHEFLLTPEGTALVTCRPAITRADVGAIGGPRNGTVYDSIVQEIDVRTGRLLLEWRGLDHIALAESHRAPGGVVDYLHVNSVQPLPDGHLLLSARNTWALYKIDRRSGAVIWRLGGKRSDFAIGRGAEFSWQHDARHPLPGTLTVFDNGSDGPIRSASQSRALKLAVDERRRTVRVATAYSHPAPLLASSMGSVQILPNGHVVVGWGAEPFISEFTPDAKAIADLRLVPGQLSYRGLRLPWRGTPNTAPAIAVRRKPRTGARTLYVSWNGSTETALWQVLIGRRRSAVQPIGTAGKTGFETAIELGSADGYVAVAALDRFGARLARSETIPV